MKLLKRLTVDGAEVPLVDEDIRLDLARPGRAAFLVRSAVGLTGTVIFALGWHWAPALTVFFTGEVERCTQVDGAQQRLFCRELLARLDARIPLALRHPTMQDVLARYGACTGLRFILPSRHYAATRVPAFCTLGSGFHGMASLGAVFGIEDYLLQAQGDGQVFVGSWADSRWASRPVTLPDAMFGQGQAQGARTVAAIPSLRPGAVLNGARVSTVRLAGHEMEITCKTS